MYLDREMAEKIPKFWELIYDLFTKSALWNLRGSFRIQLQRCEPKIPKLKNKKEQAASKPPRSAAK
jgi:hypothetical protein